MRGAACFVWLVVALLAAGCLAEPAASERADAPMPYPALHLGADQGWALLNVSSILTGAIDVMFQVQESGIETWGGIYMFAIHDDGRVENVMLPGGPEPDPVLGSEAEYQPWGLDVPEGVHDVLVVWLGQGAGGLNMSLPNPGRIDVVAWGDGVDLHGPADFVTADNLTGTQGRAAQETAGEWRLTSFKYRHYFDATRWRVDLGGATVASGDTREDHSFSNGSARVLMISREPVEISYERLADFGEWYPYVMSVPLPAATAWQETVSHEREHF